MIAFMDYEISVMVCNCHKCGKRIPEHARYISGNTNSNYYRDKHGIITKEEYTVINDDYRTYDFCSIGCLRSYRDPDWVFGFTFRGGKDDYVDEYGIPWK